MNKLNICIDIDGTITEPYYWLDIFNKHFNSNIKEDEVITYNIHEVIGIDESEYDKFYESNKITIHSQEKVREDAKLVLSKINKHHKVYFITARGQELEEFTKQYLKENNISFRDVFVLGSHYKVDKAKELNCDLFIEDNPNNAIELSKAGFKVVLIDTNYNKDVKSNKNITRIRTWNELYKIINEINLDRLCEIE